MKKDSNINFPLGWGGSAVCLYIKGFIVRGVKGEEIERQRVLCGETRLLRTGIVRVLQSTECPWCGEGAGEEEGRKLGDFVG